MHAARSWSRMDGALARPLLPIAEPPGILAALVWRLLTPPWQQQYATGIPWRDTHATAALLAKHRTFAAAART
eukprot:9198671-Prorocentrum_lima.AAC.1